MPLFVLLPASAGLIAQSPSKLATDSEAERRLAVFHEEILQHQLFTDGEPLTLLKTPALMHRNSVRRFQSGAVYIWEDVDQLPAAICDIMLFEKNGTVLLQEFHSLSRQKIEGRLGNRGVQWEPTLGIHWEPMQDMDRRVDAMRQFLIVARGCVRQLKAHCIDHEENKDIRRELRLLAEPLHKYQVTKNSETIRGGIFAFCLDVDPEIIVCVESRQGPEGVARWFRAFGGFSDGSLFVSHGETGNLERRASHLESSRSPFWAC